VEGMQIEVGRDIRLEKFLEAMVEQFTFDLG
jgi:hypothetical protein